MHVLHIEHAVPDFEAWKRAFDGDPVERAESGARRHTIARAVDDPNYVSIDLLFDTEAEATRMLGRLRQLWSRVEGRVIISPQARIAEITEDYVH
jgi:hypothetical protein